MLPQINLGNSQQLVNQNIENAVQHSQWNYKLEKSIQSLGELSLGYKWMHCEMAKDNVVVYDRIMYSSILMGPIAGVLNTVNSYIGDTMVIPILITFFSFLTGVLVSILKFANYEEKIANHKASAAHYTSLANNARIQLNLERPDREDPKQYIIWYTTSYGNLFESSPILPDYVMSKYRCHAKKYGFKIPGEVGILLDTSSDNSPRKELAELKKELYKTSMRKYESSDNIRLKMYSIGNNSEREFTKMDLAKFNNITMKRKIADTNRSIESSRVVSSRTDTTRTDTTRTNTWRDNLPPV